MKSILASPAEARAAATGTLGLIVRPVKWRIGRSGTELAFPTPRAFEYAADSATIYWHHGSEHTFTACPLGGPGDVLGVKESWTFRWDDDGPTEDVLYEADGEYVMCAEERFTKAGVERSPWLSPARMRPEHVRSHVRILSVEVRRVQTITDAEVRATGETRSNTAVGWTPGEFFAEAWDRRFEKRGLGWGVDPWCWMARCESVEVGRG